MSEESRKTVSAEMEDALTSQIMTLRALINILELKGFVPKKEMVD